MTARYQPTISLGNIIAGAMMLVTLASTLGAMVYGYGQLNLKVDTQDSGIQALRARVDAQEVRIRAVEVDAARNGAKFDAILDRLDRLDDKMDQMVRNKP